MSPLPNRRKLLRRKRSPTSRSFRPTLNTSPLPKYGYDKLDYGMTIGIERTPGGRLWACWVAGGDSPKAFFVLATSDDDGETWSTPRLVVDAHAKDLPGGAQRAGGQSLDRSARPIVADLRSVDGHVRRPRRRVGRRLRKPRCRRAQLVRAAPHLAWRDAQQADRALHRRMDAADFARSARRLSAISKAASKSSIRSAARTSSSRPIRAKRGSVAAACNSRIPIGTSI